VRIKQFKLQLKERNIGSGLYKTNIVWSIDPDKSDAVKYYNRLKTKGYKAKLIHFEGGGWKGTSTPDFVLNNASRMVTIGHGANSGKVQGPTPNDGLWDADELVRQLRGIVQKEYYQLVSFLACFSGGVEEEFNYFDGNAMKHVDKLSYADSIGYKFINILPGVVEVHASGGIVVSTTTATEYVKSSTTSGRGVKRAGGVDKLIFKRVRGQIKPFTRGY
jgi:hypothetical protein